MNRFDFNELIERAFCEGYEYALEEQREFGNKENKRKKREWLEKLGEKSSKDDKDSSRTQVWLKMWKRGKDPGPFRIKELEESGNVHEGRRKNFMNQNKDWHNVKNINQVINKRQWWINSHSDKNTSRDEAAESYNFYLLRKLKKEDQKRKALMGAATLGTGAAVGATAYGIKKYRDKKRKENEEQNKKEED